GAARSFPSLPSTSQSVCRSTGLAWHDATPRRMLRLWRLLQHLRRMVLCSKGVCASSASFSLPSSCPSTPSFSASSRAPAGTAPRGGGLAGATAVWVASLKGHGQFAGRIVEIFFGRNLKAMTIARIAIGVVPACLILLFLARGGTSRL